jgi:CubicO group peptidase (beta-lactamase class C family)
LAFDTNKLGRIGDWMQTYVDRKRFAGCSVLVAQGGQEVYFDAKGQRDTDTGQPFTRDTIARIYSMTKPVTSVGIMMLAERGLFHLDAPVSDFIPAFADMRCLIDGATAADQTEPSQTPTLHQLLTHTSGLSYPFNPGITAKAMDEADILFRADQGSLAEMTDRVAALPLAFHPGTRWEYSVGIDVLGRVIEVVSGKSLETFLVDEILGPLDMDETRFSVPVGGIDRFASLYTPLAGSAYGMNAAKPETPVLRCVDKPDTSPFLNAEMHSGGGGLVGTIDDYLKFTEMLRTGGAGLISPKTLDFMMRNHLPGDIASMGPASFAEQPMEGMGFGLGGAVVLNPGRVRVPSSLGDFSWGGMASTFTQLAPSSSYPARPQLKALIHGAMT